MPPLSLSAHHHTANGLRVLITAKPGALHVERTPIHFRILSKAHPATHDKVDIPESDLLMQSKRAFLVWETSSASPKLAFHRDDVRFVDAEATSAKYTSGLRRSFYSPSQPPSKLANAYFDLIIDGKEDEHSKYAAWTFSRNTPLTEWTSKDAPAPDELIVLQASKFPQIWEENDPMIGGVRNPYHRVDALRSSRHVKVLVKSKDGKSEWVVADTKDVKGDAKDSVKALFETGYPTRWYLPASASKAGLSTGSSFVPNIGAGVSDFPKEGLRTVCPYKGYAYYHTIRLPDGEELKNMAWSYPEAIPALDLRNLIAFWTPGNERFRLIVDGEDVE